MGGFENARFHFVKKRMRFHARRYTARAICITASLRTALTRKLALSVRTAKIPESRVFAKQSVFFLILDCELFLTTVLCVKWVFANNILRKLLSLVWKQSLLRKLFKKFFPIQFRLVTMTDPDYVKVEYDKVSKWNEAKSANLLWFVFGRVAFLRKSNFPRDQLAPISPLFMIFTTGIWIGPSDGHV